MKSYEHLEGKEVTVVHRGTSHAGVVAVIEYGIGITIVRVEDKDDELCCLNWKDMRNPPQHSTHYTILPWTQAQLDVGFEGIIKGIEEGIVDNDAIMGKVFALSGQKEVSRNGHGARCAFK